MAVRPSRDMVKMTHELHVERLPAHTIEAARKTVAANSSGPEDFFAILDILGLSSTVAEIPVCPHSSNESTCSSASCRDCAAPSIDE